MDDIRMAINTLKLANELSGIDKSETDYMDNSHLYKANLTAIIALEKQIPRKTKYKTTCPVCNTYNSVWNKRTNTKPGDIVYCWYCGNAIKLDWSVEE